MNAIRRAGRITSEATRDFSGCLCRRLWARVWLFCAALLAASLFSLHAASAAYLKADLSAVQEEGYARLILTFPELTLLPSYDASLTNGVLRVSFRDPVAIEVSQIPLALPDYISIARRDPDGSAVRFALTQELRINTMEAGERLFIDLLPRDWVGLPPGLPEDVVKELAERAADALSKARALELAQATRKEKAPEVNLRVGYHPTFTRLSFDWSLPFDTAFVREGDLVKLTFSHDAPIDLMALKRQKPPGLVDATSFSDNGKLKILMRIDPSVDVRAFREDASYIVDVTPHSMPQDVVNDAIDSQLDPDLPEGARELVTAPAESSASTVEGQPARRVEEQSAVKTAPVVNAALNEKATPSTSGEELDIPPAIDVEADGDPQITKALAPPQPAAGPETPPEDHDMAERRFVPAEARRIGDTVRVVFPFADPVSSAVFKRNDTIWMIFDTDAPIDIRGMRTVLGPDAETVELTSESGRQVLRVDLSKDALTTIGVDGSSWVLTIGDIILEPSRPLRVERNVRSDGGGILRIPFDEPQNVYELTDPVVGDTIYVVTGFGPARGVIKSQKFVDLETLQSAQGVAAVGRSDHLQVKLLGSAIVFERPEGLNLSNRELKGGSSFLRGLGDPTRVSYIDLSSVLTSGTPDLQKRVREVRQQVSSASEPEERQRLHMELGRLYLAHGFAQEALGVMKLAAEEAPALESEANFNLLMGAAQQLASRPVEALEFLNLPALKNSPDAAVWQMMAAAELNDWADARLSIPRAQAVIGSYPPSVQVEFNLDAAQAMVEINDFGAATEILAEIDPSMIERDQAARYDILRGRVADASGRSLEALRAYEVVQRSGDRPRAAEAGYRALRIKYRDGDLSTADAIDELVGLAASWRGDETELKTLRFLAQLYAAQKEYRSAFEVMRAAVQADPGATTTRLLQDEMEEVFAKLFHDGGADDMDPVKALALFYDFRELMPIGRKGDDMVRKLANRLVSMDLLAQAGELLQHQVDNRLKGAARAQIAADLAVVYLMNRKPEQALRVLARTRQAQLPRELERQRNIVEARALTESGRPEIALEIVRNMRGSDVQRLRADTLWAAQSWRLAGEELESLHGARWSDSIPLGETERSDILRAAIAYSLAEDEFSLQRLQSKFSRKMSDSEQAEAFDIVTRPGEERGVEFMSVANALENIDSLDTFLREYQRQYLSAPSTAEAYGGKPAELEQSRAPSMDVAQASR